MATGPLSCVWPILFLLPFVLCQSVVTVTPTLSVESISVKQFEKDYYDAFQSYVNTRTKSDELTKLNKLLLDQNQEISLDELPNALEVN